MLSLELSCGLLLMFPTENKRLFLIQHFLHVQHDGKWLINNHQLNPEFFSNMNFQLIRTRRFPD